MPVLTTHDLAAELANLLNEVVQGWSIERTENAPPSAERVGFAQVVDGRHEAWVASTDHRERVTIGLPAGRLVSPNEIRLIKRVLSVFRSDLQVVGDVSVAQDLWSALAATQFLRAAARLSPFSATPLLRWIRIFEAAARQTYEGSRFTGNVVLVKHLPTFAQRANARFHSFNQPLSFEQALLRESWLKPFLQNGKFALVAGGQSGAAQGFADTSGEWEDSVVLAPAEDLKGLYGFLRTGTSILSASRSGDIHFALSTGVTFINSQGTWLFQDWGVLRRLLEARLSADIAEHALQLVAGCRYERRGSLFVFLDAGVDPSEIVPDHANPDRVARTLRSSVSGGVLGDPASIRVLQAASGIDGAVLLDDHGRILDVASMITEPSPAALAAAGRQDLERFPGARSTAAWNASICGLAIKVSDDGPVDVYEHGQHVFHSG
jgi:hypothetical protein